MFVVNGRGFLFSLHLKQSVYRYNVRIYPSHNAKKEDPPMPIPVMIGALLATTALVLYLIGILMTAITGKVKTRNVVLQTAGVVCDAIATICMMIQAGGLIPADFHGWIGYTALALMVVDLVFVLRHKKDGIAPTAMRVFALVTMAFWIVSYCLGFMKMG